MINDERLAACFPRKGIELDEDELDQTAGGVSYPDQVVFYCSECREAKTVLRSGNLLSCPDCGAPFGTVSPLMSRP